MPKILIVDDEEDQEQLIHPKICTQGFPSGLSVFICKEWTGCT